MVTSSVVSSLNALTEMTNATKTKANKSDDKFKDLMNKDASDKANDDSSCVDDARSDDKKVNSKSEKNDSKKEDKNLSDETLIEEKVISSELAKMMVNVNSAMENVETVVEHISNVNLVNEGFVDTNIVDDGNFVPVQINLDDSKENQAVNSDKVMVTNQLNGNEKVAGQEGGRIQLNEAFEPVNENDGLKMAEMIQNIINKEGNQEEKVSDNVVVNVETGVNKIDFNRPSSVQDMNLVSNLETIYKPEETIDKMVKSFIQEFTQGKHEMEIALEPANLGKLTIKVAYESGKAMVSILCNERNLDIISKNSAQIAAIIQDYTGDDTKIIIEHPEMDYLNQENQQKEQQQREQEYKNKNDKAIDDKESVDFLEQLRLGLVKEV